jgi:hypothetical protein
MRALHPWFEANTSPIYGFAFPADMNEAGLVEYCNWFADWYSCQVKSLGMICDLSAASLITPRQRQIWTSFETRAEAHLKRVLRGVAIIAPSAVHRGIVTATYWMKRPVYDWQVFQEREAGRAWLNERLSGCK